VRTLLSRIAGIFGRRRRDQELDDEVRFHLDMTAEKYQRGGMSADEALRAARREFGGVMQVKEAYRDQRGLPWMETLIQDARYGIRSLLHTPAFTLAALLTLALGIGANTAIFSVVDAVLLRPLPYPEPDRIVALMRRHPEGEWNRHTGRRYLEFRDHLHGVDGVAAWLGSSGVNLVTGDTAEFVRVMRVSSEFFPVFGVPPAIGQAFTREQDVSGGPAVVILGDELWRRTFGADPGVIGRSILLGEQSLTVIGVMPSSFVPPGRADLYVPLRPSTSGPGGGFNYHVVARLSPGVSIEQANAAAAGIWESTRTSFPMQMVRNELPSAFASLRHDLSSSVQSPLLMMFAAVGLLLLIACANTANLLLARASGRGREIALRAALGAGRGRIIRQLLTESVLLAVTGAWLGILLAVWAVPALLALTPPGFIVNQEVSLNATVLLITMAAAVVTGLLFGLGPALSVSGHSLVESFKDDRTRGSGSGRSTGLRQTLVVSEMAVCMLLLIAAGLLIQTFVRMRAVDLGFNPEGVLTARMSLQGERYAKMEDLNRFFDRGLDGLRRIPGVHSAAVVSGVPVEFGLNLNVDILDGPVKLENQLTDWRYASIGYFETMGIPIVAGRGFEERDRAGAPPVAVVSESFARRFYEGTEALGRHIRVFDTDGTIEIVGIAKDVREQGLVDELPALMYVPVTQANRAGVAASHTYFQMSWVVRANRTGPELIQQIREEIRSLDPKQPIALFRTMVEVKAAAMALQKFQMTLLVIFAVIGLLLATAGLYGLISYSVLQRTREFGIRIALGATQGTILRSVIWSGTVLSLLGVAVGTAAAMMMTRALHNFVWGVSTLDPFTFGAVALILVVVAMLATLIPAVRAVRLNPVVALRE
jgi:putative ABC transport system permease protein